MFWTDLVGYAGGILIVVSLFRSNLKNQHLLHFIGSAIFTTYGILITSYPVILLHLALAGRNFHSWLHLRQKKDFFQLVETENRDDLFVRTFIEFHKKDIQNFFPHFHLKEIMKPQTILILRDYIPVGVFIFEINDEQDAEIHLDYVIPNYRDLKNAQFLYERIETSLQKRGIKFFSTRTSIGSHKDYLRVMGFEADPGDPGYFRRAIGAEVTANS